MSRIALWTWAALCLWCGAAWGTELSKDEYARLVDRAASGLQQAASSRERRRSRAIRAIDLLPEEAEVEVTDGGPAVRVDNRELRAALRRLVRSGPDGIREAAAIVGNLRRGLVLSDVSPPPQARSALAAVLSRREFRPSLANRIRAWLYRVGLGLLQWLFQRFPSLSRLHLGPAARVVAYAFLGVMAATVLYLLVRVLGRPAWGRRQPERALAESAEASRPMTQTEWLTEAETAIASGDYRLALRALHMAALMRLDELGAVSFSRAAADGHFVRQLRRSGREAEAEALAGLNRVFSWAWYGGRATGPAEYESAQARWRELEALTAT